MLTIDEIEKIVDERVKDAKRKQIWEKALKVIDVCGKETLYSKLFGYFVKKYSDYYIQIKFDRFGKSLEIKERQENNNFKAVFYMWNNKIVDKYIPGKWEDYLENLYVKAYQIDSEKKINKLRENFGI
jgi:hypothetical protein